jgi:hypothetical protein
MSALLPDAPWYVLAAVPFVILAGYIMFGATGFGFVDHFSSRACPLVSADVCGAADHGARLCRDDQREFSSVAPRRFRRVATHCAGNAHRDRGGYDGTVQAAAWAGAVGVGPVRHGVRHSFVRWGTTRVEGGASFWAWPVGIVGGMFSAVFGTGGPIYIVYLAARIHDKTALRATMSLMITISVILRTTVFIVTGLLLQLPVVAAAIVLLPLMFIGYYLGNRVHHALSRAGVMKVIAVLLVVNGASLIVRAFAM